MDTDIEKQPVTLSTGPAISNSNSNSDDTSKLSNCKLGWENISFAVDTKQGKKQILQNVSGCVEKGPSMKVAG
jgi:hypothetical protein